MSPRKAQPEAQPLILESEPVTTNPSQARAVAEQALLNAGPEAAMQVHELITRATAPVVQHHATRPMDILMDIMQRPDLDLDRLERMLALQERWEANAARNAFNAAFAAFKAESVMIVKNITVTDGPLKGKKYADLFAVVNTITPALSKHGLSASWKLTKDEPVWLEVTCTLRHAEGHAETVSMGGPPDAGGAKSAIQGRASSKSYLERYTLLAITGLASSDGDKDGQSSAQAFGMDEDAFQGHLKALREAATIAALQTAFTAAWTAAKTDKPTQTAILEAKDKRKKELAGGAK